MSGFFDIFGSAPKLNNGPANTYINALGNIANKYGLQADKADAQYDQFNGRNTDALNTYSNYLKADPATEQYNALQIANAERGMSQGAVRAKGNLSLDMARRGIQPGSGIFVGGLAHIDQGLAENDANIRNDVADNNINRHGQNLNTLSNLWSNASNTQFNRANTLRGNQTNINQGLLSEADQLALQQYQADVQRQSAQGQMLGQLGQAAAAAYGA